MAAVPWVGRGESKKADAAAVQAMRDSFADLPGQGTVVIGEGEKDGAPMLFNGELVDAGGDPGFDLAVDPLDNTSACARGSPDAVSVAVAAPRGSLWATAGFYIDKLIVGAGRRRRRGHPPVRGGQPGRGRRGALARRGPRGPAGRRG
ncbi:MAG: fructose-bisphosphatase class II family protein, partial [Actinomycetota bacterium]|nr:fructose-bisphosphatase class II family protein [Actinomycetota bacterium]